MTFANRIVTEIPLENIWNSQKEMNIQRSSFLTKERIKEMLRNGPVDFILADVGNKLEWIATSNCYNFWKSEVEIHLTENLPEIDLDDFPNDYAYIASEWTGDIKTPIILLEKY